MAKNYKEINYFETRPDIVKIFNDLEAYLDFCRIELMPFNEADLYNRDSYVWRAFDNSRRPKKAWNGERKPYLGKNPRPQNTFNKPRYNNS
jgi:hypothetical protein